MKFIVTTEGKDTLGLRALAQTFADSQWVPTHYSTEQAAEFILDQFRRMVADELEMVEVRSEALSAS